MLTCLGLLSLLAAPRRSSAPMRVTGAYLRTHDPTFVAQMLRDADEPQTRRAAASVLGTDLLAARPAALARYRRFLDGVVSGEIKTPTPPRRAGASYSPAAPGAFDMAEITQHLPKLGDLGLPPHDRTFHRNLGAAIQGATAPQTTIHATAAKDGTLAVPPPKFPFYVDRIRVFTGVVEDGKKLWKSYGSSASVPIEAGQDWAVDFAVQTSQIGDYQGTFVVDDGVKNTVDLRAKTLSATGDLAFWAEECGKEMAQGDVQTFKLHVHTTSNGISKLVVSGSSDMAGVKVENAYLDIPKGEGDATVTCKIRTDADAPDGSGTLNFVATAYDGAKSVAASTGLGVHTVWTIVPGPSLTSGGGATLPTLRYTNGGYWSLSAGISNSTKANVEVEVAFSTDLQYTDLNAGEFFHPGAMAGGYLGPKEAKLFEVHGVDPILKGPQIPKVAQWGFYAGPHEGFEGWYYGWWNLTHFANLRK